MAVSTPVVESVPAPPVQAPVARTSTTAGRATVGRLNMARGVAGPFRRALAATSSSGCGAREHQSGGVTARCPPARPEMAAAAETGGAATEGAAPPDAASAVPAPRVDLPCFGAATEAVDPPGAYS